MKQEQIKVGWPRQPVNKTNYLYDCPKCFHDEFPETICPRCKNTKLFKYGTCVPVDEKEVAHVGK